MSVRELRKSGKYDFPSFVADGNGRSLLLSKEMDKLLWIIATQFIENDASLKKSFSKKDLHGLVRRTFGPALAQIDPDGDVSANAEIILDKVRTKITEEREANTKPLEFCFGCTLFANPDIPAFSIGPVKFEPRSVWLDRKKKDGEISKTTVNRIMRRWSTQSEAKGPLRKRKPTVDSICEIDILDAVSESPYVCSIATKGFSVAFGRDRAELAGRIAMTSVALLWAVPSRVLSGFNFVFDFPESHRISLQCAPQRTPLSSRERVRMPHGPTVDFDEWQELKSDAFDHFQVVGEILSSLVEGVASPQRRAELVRAFSHSFLWFHEACRERLPVVAVVKFAASLDALACGKGEKAILKLIEARLKIDRDAPLFVDGMTVAQAVSKIYSSGRSRTIHGNNPDLGLDWEDVRGRAEYLARLCLVMCIDWARHSENVNLASIQNR